MNNIKKIKNISEESTHLFFQGDAIHISPNLSPIAKFISNIEKEIDELFSINKRLEDILKQYRELLECTKIVTEKLENNKHVIDFSFSEPPQTILEKTTWQRPLRAEMITVFAYMETLMCFYLAYTYEISDEEGLRKKMQKTDSVKEFINSFIISNDNQWCQLHPRRAKRFTWKELRNIRNSLTHFFSVAKDGLSAATIYDNTVKEAEQKTKSKVKFITPDDLRIMVRSAALLLFKTWDKDYRDSLQRGDKNFENKIKFVKTIVDRDASLIFRYDQPKTNGEM